MNTFTNDNKENGTTESSPKTGWQSIGKQLKSFFTNKNQTPLVGNEIDYYHQYIYPHKANKLLRNKVEQVHTTYVPFAKRR